MNKYQVKITCEYYVDVEAENEEEAREAAIESDYDLSDLQNFYYEIESQEKIENELDDMFAESLKALANLGITNE